MELERQKRVISMMITMHSILSCKYSRKANFFEIILLIVSGVLNTLVFIDTNFITRVTSINPLNQQLLIGIASVTVFTISIVLLKVNWKEKSESHRKAAEQLFILLQDCRMILNLPDHEEKNLQTFEFNKRYRQITNMLEKIPNSKFNSLKSAHYRKLELSKLIDRFPGSTLFVLKVKLFLSSF
jgi:hypothetical protein